MEQFEQAYQRALLRKRLFKEYLSRHQVLECLNQALEELYKAETLPDDPLSFLCKHIDHISTSMQNGGR